MKQLLIIAVLFAFALQVEAQGETFRVSTFIANDITPPTTPATSSAVAVTESQIDVSWSPSADNVAVGGYQVFRDGIQISTTTLTTYSDTGLAPVTTYSYRIVAFDTAFNFATSTATVTATTLSSSTPSSGSAGGGSIDPVETLLTNLIVDTSFDSVEVSFDTNVFTKATLSWGRTTNYELGYVASDQFKRSHLTMITGLQPGTLYELKIALERRFSGETIIETVQFSTPSLPDNTPPPNVTDFRVFEQSSGDLELSWTNPEVDDFSHVRIVSSDRFYPSDEFDGWFVYEGPLMTIVDDRPLVEDVRYYTIFAYDTNGNRSSGAVTQIGAVQQPEESTGVDLGYESFDFDDLIISQEGVIVSSPGTVPLLSEGRETTFSLPYESLPENLKTIIITLRDTESNKSFSFLLSINAARDAYDATISLFPQVGVYTVEIAVYDHAEQVIVKRVGEVSVVTEGQVVRIERIETITHINWPLIIVIALLVLLFIYSVRRLVPAEDNVPSTASTGDV